MTRVVNKYKENYDIYIGRGSIWGNPFSHLDNTLALFKVASREEAVSKYEEYLLSKPELMAKLSELKEKTLGCFCKPKSCHGDILVKYINMLPEKE
jgi:hypothetical protein